MDIQLSLDAPLDIPPVAEHQPVEFVCLAPLGARLALSLDGQLLDPFLRPGEPAWHWRWNAGTAVGLHQALLIVTWPDGSADQRVAALRVVPRKIDQDRYEALLDDIQRIAYGIVYALSGAGAEGARLQREAPWQHSPAEEYYALFEERLELFARAVRRIAARPREQLRRGTAQSPLGQVPALGAEAIAQVTRGIFDEAPPGVADELQEALRPGGGLLPRDVATSRSAPTTDTYEHRLLKHLLTLLLRRVRWIGSLAEREVERLAAGTALAGGTGARLVRARRIAAGCVEAQQQLRELRALPLLAEVAPLAAFRGPSPLFQRDPAYREVYRMWQALREHPYIAFDSPHFAIPIADLPRLYESWCALEVVRALLALGGDVREQRLVVQRRGASQEDELTFAVELAEQAPLLVIDHGACTLTLRYQPRYRPQRTAHGDRLESLDRYTHVPDLAIEVRREGAAPQVLLLDAKYRIDAEGRGVPPDALADGYTYLGAIGCGGARATLGSLLLYPGTGAPERYASGVGVLPLLPGRGAQTAAHLAGWLGLAHEFPLAKHENV
jgi:hypothetical protein